MRNPVSEQMDALYAANPDPWNFRQSAYEQQKYRETLSHLPRQRYAHALEIGCSIGILGGMIADRADRYLGIDASERALAIARDHLAPGIANGSIRLAQHVVPESFPEGPFDLILLSEILYFLKAEDMAPLAARIKAAGPEADIVCVNYLGPADAGSLEGAEALELFAQALGRSASTTTVSDLYRIDVFAHEDRGGADVPR